MRGAERLQTPWLTPVASDRMMLPMLRVRAGRGGPLSGCVSSAPPSPTRADWHKRLGAPNPRLFDGVSWRIAAVSARQTPFRDPAINA